jgi:hypothetical protein
MLEGGRHSLMILVDCIDRANLRGRGFMTRKVLRPVALIGTVAAMFAVTIVLTLSHATVSMNGVGNLKCYTPAGIEKAC